MRRKMEEADAARRRLRVRALQDLGLRGWDGVGHSIHSLLFISLTCWLMADHESFVNMDPCSRDLDGWSVVNLPPHELGAVVPTMYLWR